jgi:hypothetical protein
MACPHGFKESPIRGRCPECADRRDRFAAAALTGLLAGIGPHELRKDQFCKMAIEHADALIAELDK